MTVTSPMRRPGRPGWPRRGRTAVLPAPEQADERIAPACRARRRTPDRRLAAAAAGRGAALARRLPVARQRASRAAAPRATAPSRRLSERAASASRVDVIPRSLPRRRLLRHDAARPSCAPAAASCSTNVVATHSAMIVAFGSGGVFARIEISLTLMIRGNLLMRSKKSPRLWYVPSACSRYGISA